MGQPIPSTDQLTEAYMRLALMRWIDELPRQELEALYNRLPVGEGKEEDEWAAFRGDSIEHTDPETSSVDESELDPELAAAYGVMANDEEREREALEWIEGTLPPNDL